MKEYANITCGILSPLDISSAIRGRTVLELLAGYSSLMPTHIGNEEPIRERYVSIDGSMSYWQDPFLWKNARSKVQGSAWFGRGEQHSCLYVDLKPDTRVTKQEHFIQFLADACTRLHADLGYLHLVTNQEFQDTEIPHAFTYAIDRGITTHDLRKGLPNLCWGMVFGGHYQHLVERFRRYASTNTKELQEGRVYVQLSDSLFGCCHDYRKFNATRLKIRSQVGEDFLTCSEGGWRPTFVFESVQ